MLNPPSGISDTDYWDAIRQGNPTHVKFEFENSGGTLTDADVNAAGGVTINSIANPDSDLTYGAAVSTEVKAVFLDSANLDTIQWENVFALSFGVEMNGNTEWICLGFFKGKTPERKEYSSTPSNVEFTAYDIVRDLDGIIADHWINFGYPQTLQSMCEKIYRDSGFDIVVPFSSTIRNIQIDVNPFPNGLTLRGVLSKIAQACGCFARAYDGSSDTITLKYFRKTSCMTLLPEDYFALDISGISVTAPGTLLLTDTNNPANTKTYTIRSTALDEVYEIVDNGIFNSIYTQADLDNLIGMLVTNIHSVMGEGTGSIQYVPSSIQCIGNWMLEAGDTIDVKYYDKNGVEQTHTMLIFSRTFTWNGSCTDVYECTGNVSRNTLTDSDKEDYKISGKISGKKDVQTPVSDPSPSGNFSMSFISSISQDSQGVITPVKDAIPLVDDLVTSTPGFPLDARQGKALKDAVDGKLDFVQLNSVASNSSSSYSVSNGGKFIVAAFGASTAKNMWIVNTTNTGAVSVMALGSSSALSASGSTRTLTITNSGNNGAQVYALELSGTISNPS